MATNRSYKQKAKIISALLFAYSLSGCAYLYDKFVYQIDVTQGNYIEEDKEAQIHLGMTQEQIIFLLGSPMMIDQFDSSKWYYIRFIKPGGEPIQQTKIVFTFKDKILVQILKDGVTKESPLVENVKKNKAPSEAVEKGDSN
jgi:outer membrane protein assembly factor BamE